MVCPDLRRKVFQNRVEIDQFRSQLLQQASQLRPRDPNLPTYALDLQLYEAAVTSVHNAVANFEASIWQSNPEIFDAHLALREEEKAAAAGVVQHAPAPAAAVQSYSAPTPSPPQPALLSDHSSNLSAPDAGHFRDLHPSEVVNTQKPGSYPPEKTPEPVTPQGKENISDALAVSSPLPPPATPELHAQASSALSDNTSVSSGEPTRMNSLTLLSAASVTAPTTPTHSSAPQFPPQPTAQPVTPNPAVPPTAGAAALVTPPQPITSGVATPPNLYTPAAPTSPTAPLPTALIPVTPPHPATQPSMQQQQPPIHSPAIQQAAAALSIQPSALQAWLQNFDSIARALPALNLNGPASVPNPQSPPPQLPPQPSAPAYGVAPPNIQPTQHTPQVAMPIPRETSFSSTATQLSYAPSSTVSHSYAMGGTMSRSNMQHFTPLGGIAEHGISHHSTGTLQLAQPTLDSMLQHSNQLQMQQAQRSAQPTYMPPSGYSLPTSPTQYTPPSPSITSSMITNHPVPSTTSDSPLARLIAEAAGMAEASNRSFKQAVHQSVNTDKEKYDPVQMFGETKGEQLYKQLDAQTLCELAQLMLSTQEAESVSSVPSGLTSHGSRAPSTISTVANSTIAKHTASYPPSSSSTSTSGDKYSSGTPDSRHKKKKKESKLTRAYKSAVKETFSNEKAADNSRLWMNWA